MEWLPARLSDLLSLEYGKALPKDARVSSGGVPVAGSNGVDGFHDAAIVEGPGIVVGRKGSAGKVNWFEDDFWPIDTTFFVRHDPEVTHIRWLYYLLQAKKLDRITKTGGVPGLNRNDAYAESCLLPPPKEQSRIVELLDAANLLRRLRHEADGKAARILPALFHKMFGDPATNPMRFPTERLDQLFDIVGGGTPSKSVDSYWQGDIPWVSPKDMKFNVIENTEDHITSEAIEESATKLVEPGSILIVYRSGILAHTFPVAFAGRPLTLNQDLKALSSKGDVSNEFLYGWFAAGQSLALSFVKKGATVHNVDGSRFLAQQIPKPPREQQITFANNLNDLFALKNYWESTADRIEDLFAMLLHKAFSGELTVRWRKAHMQELLAEIEHQARALSLNLPRKLEASS